MLSDQVIKVDGSDITENEEEGNEQMEKTDFRRHVIYKLGITEIVLGLLSCVLCLASMKSAGLNGAKGQVASLTFSSQGFWCGLYLITTGGFGISLLTSESVLVKRGNIATSLLGIVVMVLLVVLSSFAVYYNAHSLQLQLVTVFHYTLAMLGGIGIGVCSLHFGYCCADHFSTRSEPDDQEFEWVSSPQSQEEIFPDERSSSDCSRIHESPVPITLTYPAPGQMSKFTSLYSLSVGSSTPPPPYSSPNSSPITPRYINKVHTSPPPEYTTWNDSMGTFV